MDVMEVESGVVWTMRGPEWNSASAEAKVGGIIGQSLAGDSGGNDV